MSRQAGRLAQIGLYCDCYALCLPLVPLVWGPRWTLLSVGGVHFFGMFVGRVCVFGVWRLGGCLLGPWLLPTLARGTSQTPGWLFCCWCRGGAAHCSLCCFLCLKRQFGGFLVFLAFSAPFFRIYFLGLLKPTWFWWCGVAHDWKRVIPGRLYSPRCSGGSPLFPVLSFVTVGHWVIGRPRNGSGGGLLELLLWRFLGFPVLTLPMVHSAQ